MTDKPILSCYHETTALLVIDVQLGMFHKSTPVYHSDEMLRNINMLIDRAHQAGAAVIFVQHCDARSLVKGTPDWQLHPELHFRAGDDTLEKQHSNAFEVTDLDKALKSKGITSLVITGMVTHGCVKNTCLGAVLLRYKTVLVEDGHSSFSKDAESLIEQWNAKLRDQGVIVAPSGEIAFS